MENHSYAEVLQNATAPYLRHLARAGTSYTAFHAETHPSEPNYLALFSGGMQGVTDDSCPHSFAADNVAHQLLSRGFTFAAYSEGLPSVGWLGCTRGSYARRHAPWTNFADVPRAIQLPMTSFPRDLSALPDVSFVVPDLDHDMHDGSVGAGDAWVSAHLSNYARWAATHRSLLVVTFDEDDRSEQNLIPTFAVGQGVPARLDAAPLNHYSLLAALEDLFALPRIGHARGATPMRLS
jgi:phosphatidylinositol-3-phosphatase